jgi:hypothetical protein
MNKGYFGGAATFFISAGIILVIVMVGLITFGIAAELEKSRQMAGLSVADGFDPDSLPAPGAGILKLEPDNVLSCEGFSFGAANNGTRYVRESGGGRYYAAEVRSRFGIYTVYYDHLVRVQDSSLDIHTFRKLKHALYHCDGAFTQSGLRIALGSPEAPQT